MGPAGLRRRRDYRPCRLVDSVRNEDHAGLGRTVKGSQAAVAVVLAAGAEGDEVLLIRRATVTGDPWSGHIALPGGGVETGDMTLEAAARRETLEETGIDLTQSPCLAALSSVTPHLMRGSSLRIAPFVFRYAGDRTITMSHEVVEAWWLPVAELERTEAWQPMPVTVMGGATIQARGFSIRGHVLWGLTERILAEFLESRR